MSASVLALLGAFYVDLKRMMSYGGYLDGYTFHPTLGIPQGCAMSAFLCGILVDGWATQICETGAIPEAYVDDRTMYSSKPDDLLQAWKARLHCWRITSSVINSPDQFDPAAASIYCHLTSLLRGLRNGLDAWEWWVRVSLLPVPQRPRGPRAVTLHFLRKLRMQESSDMRRWEGCGVVLDILSDPWQALKHKLRVCLRDWMLRGSSESRKNTEGAMRLLCPFLPNCSEAHMSFVGLKCVPSLRMGCGPTAGSTRQGFERRPIVKLVEPRMRR